jgi:hypothetical protein
MLVRGDGLVIGQPAHAWVSGQLARAWAGPVEPWEEVCLAASERATTTDARGADQRRLSVEVELGRLMNGTARAIASRGCAPPRRAASLP